MPKTLSTTARSLIAFLLVVISAVLWQTIPNWSHIVEWLNYFLFRGTGWTLLSAALVAAVLRRLLLNLKPRFSACFFLYILFYLIIFCSRWFPYGAHPDLPIYSVIF